VVYERAGLLFVFNFHPSKSFTDYRVGVDDAGEYGIVLSSDEGKFGGFDNIALDSKFFTTPMEWNGRKNWIQVCFYDQEFLLVTSMTLSSRYIYRPGRALFWPKATDRLVWMVALFLNSRILLGLTENYDVRETCGRRFCIVRCIASIGR